MTRWSRWVRYKMIIGGTLLLQLLAVVGSATAQEPTQESWPKVEVAIGTWLSVGTTTWAHNASSDPRLGNPTSKLQFKDHGTNVIDVSGKVWANRRFFGRLNFGYASIGSGDLTDDDFLAADRGAVSSRTHSDLQGDNLWYVNLDAGLRVAEFPNHRGWLDVFGGFQVWHQTLTAFGVTQISCSNNGATVDLGGGATLCNPVTPPTPTSILAITNTTNWYSIRVGTQAEYRLTRRFSVLGSVAFKPVSILDNKDQHHLRSDLQQDPSFSMVGYGVGADANAGIKLMIVKNLFANVGYQVWWNRMLTGTMTTHPVGSGSESFPLTEFQSLRHGITFGLSYTFS